MADNIDESKVLISEFNDGIAKIQRLNNIWNLCHSFSTKGNLIAYKWQLDRAWVELSSSAIQRDKNNKIEKEKNVNKIKNHNENIANVIRDKEKLYKALLEKEIFLRCLAKDLGIEGKDKSPDDDDDF